MIIYMAAPVGAPTVTEIRANLARARRWLWWLRRTRPNDTILCPWIADVELALDNQGDEKTGRANGLRDCEAIVSRCDGIAVCGGRMTDGMARECGAFLRATLGHGLVLDLLHLGQEPPEVA